MEAIDIGMCHRNIDGFEKEDQTMMRQKVALRILLAGVLSSATLACSIAFAQGTGSYPSTPDGVWSGTAAYNGQQVPLHLEITGNGDQVQGSLINGKDKSPSSSGSYSNGHLVLRFDYYANTIDATLNDGALTGTFGSHSRSIPITASLNAKPAAASPDPPDITGPWEIAVKGPKGESAWELQVRQSGAEVDAVIQRIDGDTGNLYGTWRDGQFALSHFTAAGPSYAVLRPQADGTLQVVTFSRVGTQELTARRPQVARSEGLNKPDDPLQHTRLKDPAQPLAFSGKDLNGKLIASSDPDFKGKVVILSIGGSWCPNCHDEAPFLEEPYRKYQGRGLDVIELSFEEEDQLANPERLKAVIQRYGITFPVLLAGTPDQLNEKLPQAVGLNCWPTTFFIGRDGLVKAIHAGFSGPATGNGNSDLRREMNALVLKLLSDNDRASIDEQIAIP
jgi:thiol-disulfide isomerase/thioredoxin